MKTSYIPVHCIMTDETKQWEISLKSQGTQVERLSPCDSGCETCEVVNECKEDTITRVELSLNPFFEPGQKLEAYISKQVRLDEGVDVVVPKGSLVRKDTGEYITLDRSIPLVLDETLLGKIRGARLSGSSWEQKYYGDYLISFQAGNQHLVVQAGSLSSVH